MFTLVLWIFGIQTIFDQIIGEKGYEELIRLLENGGITTLVILSLGVGLDVLQLPLVQTQG